MISIPTRQARLIGLSSTSRFTATLWRIEKILEGRDGLFTGLLPYGIGQAIIFLPCGFFFFYLSFFFPRLISAVADWMHTIHPHMVWP